VDRHDKHGNAPYPLAHNPGTSEDVRGPVRFPVALRWYRRDAARPQGEAFVRTPCPDRPIPTKKKARPQRPKVVAPV
jgi:hypothetical protein